jgi:vacuolar-type H+-ATPase subunit I/STV1
MLQSVAEDLNEVSKRVRLIRANLDDTCKSIERSDYFHDEALCNVEVGIDRVRKRKDQLLKVVRDALKAEGVTA